MRIFYLYLMFNMMSAYEKMTALYLSIKKELGPKPPGGRLNKKRRSYQVWRFSC